MTAITPDTHAKTIFTSGSTGKPKAVIQTQRILTGIVAQHQAMYEEADHETQARAFLSWVPWSHVGGNNKIGRASCRARVCQNVSISVVSVPLKKNKHKQETSTYKV